MIIYLFLFIPIDSLRNELNRLSSDTLNVKVFTFLDKNLHPFFVFIRLFYPESTFHPSPVYSIRKICIKSDNRIKIIRENSPFEYLEDVFFSPSLKFFVIFLKNTIWRGTWIETYNLNGELIDRAFIEIDTLSFSEWDLEFNLHIFGYNKDLVFTHYVIDFSQNKPFITSSYYPFENFEKIKNNIFFLINPNSIMTSIKKSIINIYSLEKEELKGDTLYLWNFGIRTLKLPIKNRTHYLIQRTRKNTLYIKGWLNDTFICDTLVLIQE